MDSAEHKRSGTMKNTAKRKSADEIKLPKAKAKSHNGKNAKCLSNEDYNDLFSAVLGNFDGETNDQGKKKDEPSKCGILSIENCEPIIGDNLSPISKEDTKILTARKNEATIRNKYEKKIKMVSAVEEDVVDEREEITDLRADIGVDEDQEMEVASIASEQSAASSLSDMTLDVDHWERPANVPDDNEHTPNRSEVEIAQQTPCDLQNPKKVVFRKNLLNPKKLCFNAPEQVLINNEAPKEIIEELGTWVQCSILKCKKWRYLPDISDPVCVPEFWECSMHTDVKYNSCEKAEQDYDESNHIFTKYTLGSLVWAKMDGYPWWPGIVDTDPDFDTYCEISTEESMYPIEYHVVFLDEKVTRSWIKISRIRPLLLSDLGDNSVYLKGHKFQKQVITAMKKAQQALKLSLKERLEIFGFAIYYKKFKHVAKKESEVQANKRQRIISRNSEDKCKNSVNCANYLSDNVSSGSNFSKEYGCIPVKVKGESNQCKLQYSNKSAKIKLNDEKNKILKTHRDAEYHYVEEKCEVSSKKKRHSVLCLKEDHNKKVVVACKTERGILKKLEKIPKSNKDYKPKSRKRNLGRTSLLASTHSEENQFKVNELRRESDIKLPEEKFGKSVTEEKKFKRNSVLNLSNACTKGIASVMNDDLEQEIDGPLKSVLKKANEMNSLVKDKIHKTKKDISSSYESQYEHITVNEKKGTLSLYGTATDFKLTKSKKCKKKTVDNKNTEKNISEIYFKKDDKTEHEKKEMKVLNAESLSRENNDKKCCNFKVKAENEVGTKSKVQKFVVPARNYVKQKTADPIKCTEKLLVKPKLSKDEADISDKHVHAKNSQSESLADQNLYSLSVDTPEFPEYKNNKNLSEKKETVSNDPFSSKKDKDHCVPTQCDAEISSESDNEEFITTELKLSTQKSDFNAEDSDDELCLDIGEEIPIPSLQAVLSINARDSQSYEENVHSDPLEIEEE